MKKRLTYEELVALVRNLDDATLNRLVPVANAEDRRRFDALADAQRMVAPSHQVMPS